MIKCANCGGELIYSISEQKLKCSSCGSIYDLTDSFDEDKAETIDMNAFTCPECGGEIYSNSSTAAGFCSFCGAHVTLKQRLTKWQKPEFVIPFKVQKEKAKQMVVEKLQSKHFVPNELKDANNLDICRGIYIPYWVYEVESHADLDLDCEAISGNMHSVYEVTGHAHSEKVGLNHDASISFADDIGLNLNPYNLRDAEDFSSAYLCGFYADIADEQAKKFESTVKKDALKSFKEDIKEDLERRYRDLDSIPVVLDASDTKIKNAYLCLFPVWLISYRRGDSVAYFAVNGVTGKIVTDTPIEKKKYIVDSVITAAVLSVVISILNSSTAHNLLTPIGALSILNMIGLIWGNSIMSKKMPSEDGKQFGKPNGTNIFSILLLLVSLPGFLLGSMDIPSDFLYYSYAGIEILVNIIGISKGIKNMNYITARRLPQFDYRGKDVNV